MSVPTNLIPTKITGLPEYTGSSQAGYFPYVLDGSTYKVQFSNVASAGEVPPSRTLTAGTGLVGGGDLTANRVFAIANGGVGASQLDTTGVVAGVYGNGSNVPTVTVDANGRVTSVTTSPVVATGYVPEGRTVTAGTGLLGGGSLANNITLSLNLATATPQALGTATAGVSTAAAREDHVHPAVDLSDTNETQGSLPLGRGGTGDALSPVAGAVVYSTGTKLALTNPGIPGQVLTSTGTDEPLWTTIVGTGTVTSVNASGGTTGMTFTGGPVTTVGTLTLGGTLGTANGGTGVTGTPTNGQLLIGNGSGYTLAALTAGTGVSVGNAAGAITITNTAPDQIVSLTAGTAISVSGTYPNFTINNTAPDQIVSLTGVGTTSISGTYPNFIITSNDQFVGTVTSVAASGGTTGLTFSGSPITSAGTLTLGGTLAIGSGGTGASTAGAARTALGAAALGANTDITSIALTSGTIQNAPTSGTDIVNKAYADSIASGINFHQAVRLATVAALPAYTYNNGTGGVGATITANANGALSIDGVAVVAGNRVLIKNEVGAAQANHGVYVVTQTGNGSTPFILTRATDFDSTGTGVDQIDAGDFFLVTAGSTLSNTSWVQQTPLPITIGTTPIIFSQFGAPVLYTAGTGLSLAGTVFSITNTGVTASTYGSASQVPVLAVNAQGQITSASSTSIAIAASQITSGVLPVGTGGTGATTFTANGVLLGNGTSAIGATAVGATGQVLVGNTGAAPTWATLSSTAVTSFSAGTTGLTPSSPTTGAITLGGTLAVANGGTGVTTSTGTGSVVLNTSPTLVTPTLGAASATSIANGLGAVGTPSYTFTGDLNTGMWSPAADTIAFSEGGVEAMRIDSSANVGIGTSSPGARLHVNGNTLLGGSPAAQYSGVTVATDVAIQQAQPLLNFVNAAGSTRFGYLYHTGSGGNFELLNQQAGAMLFGTSNAERMRIDSSGNVGIGTTSPGQRLTIQGAELILPAAGWSSGQTAFLYLGDTNNGVSATNGGFSTYFNFNGHNWNVNGTEAMRIDGSRNVGIGTTTPGARLDVAGGAIRVGNNHSLQFRNAAGTGTAAFILQNDDNFVVYNATGTPISSFTQGATNIAVYGSNASNRMQVDSINNATSWIVNGSERARINNSGQFLVGTTSGGRTVCINAADNWIRQSNASRSWLIGMGAESSYIIWDETGGGPRLTINTAGAVTASGDMRAPIFYDSNNTAFYVDPAGTSLLNNLTVGSGQAASSIVMGDTDEGGRSIHCNSNRIGFLTQGGGWGSWCDDGGWWGTDIAMYSPIYYDMNNSARYLDPNGTSFVQGNFYVVRDGNSNDAFGGLEIRENSYQGAGTGAATEAPGINFHWSMRAAARLYMNSGGNFVLGGQGDITNNRRSLFINELFATGNVTAYFSDERLKTRQGNIQNALQIISKLNGFRYTNNDLAKSFGYEGDQVQLGVSAQEVEAVLPEIVRQAAFDIDSDDPNCGSKSGENYKTVQYDRLVPLLIEAIKELTARVAELEGK